MIELGLIFIYYGKRAFILNCFHCFFPFFHQMRINWNFNHFFFCISHIPAFSKHIISTEFEENVSHCCNLIVVLSLFENVWNVNKTAAAPPSCIVCYWNDERTTNVWGCLAHWTSMHAMLPCHQSERKNNDK